MWMANLSTGQTAVEQPPQSGEKSTWQQLLDYCGENQIRITGLRLVFGNIVLHALPHKLCDGYFQAYEYRMTTFSQQEARLQGIGSVVGDKVYIIWIDGQGNVSSDLRELSSCRIHTTLRDAHVELIPQEQTE